MINVLELVYGEGLTPNTNPIHMFDSQRDFYEHAEFEQSNGDFYQIVKINENDIRYHFQKTGAEIEGIRLEGNWWLRHNEIPREYKDRGVMMFYDKINDRIKHGYRIIKLVSSTRPIITEHHLDFKAVNGAFPL